MKLWQYSCVACTWLSGWATTNAPGQCRVLNHSNSHRRGFRRLIGRPRLFPSPMRSLSKYLPPAFSYLCTCSIRCLWIPDYTSFLESSSLLRPFQLPLWLAKKTNSTFIPIWLSARLFPTLLSGLCFISSWTSNSVTLTHEPSPGSASSHLGNSGNFKENV